MSVSKPAAAYEMLAHIIADGGIEREL